jgi:hypothetical protein
MALGRVSGCGVATRPRAPPFFVSLLSCFALSTASGLLFV